MPIILDPNAPNPPPPTTVTSPDGILTVTTDPANAGALLVANFSALNPDPYQIRFHRGTDLVRSGDPAWAPGGIATAYDHEAPLGVASIWTATPLYADGTEGTPCQGVSVLLPAPEPAHPIWLDYWVKSIADPNLSVLVSGVGRGITRGHRGRPSLLDIPGSRHQAGSWDLPVRQQDQITFRADTYTQRDNLLACLHNGPVLVQAPPDYGIPDFYAVHVDDAETPFVWQRDPRRDITVTLAHINRPATIDAPLFVPGRSYAETTLLAATYTASLAAWPTYADIL